MNHGDDASSCNCFLVRCGVLGLSEALDTWGVPLVAYMLGCGIVFSLLQFYWFYLLIRTVARVRSGQRDVLNQGMEGHTPGHEALSSMLSSNGYQDSKKS